MNSRVLPIGPPRQFVFASRISNVSGSFRTVGHLRFDRRQGTRAAARFGASDEASHLNRVGRVTAIFSTSLPIERSVRKSGKRRAEGADPVQITRRGGLYTVEPFDRKWIHFTTDAGGRASIPHSPGLLLFQRRPGRAPGLLAVRRRIEPDACRNQAPGSWFPVEFSDVAIQIVNV
jgi:hypothetical protein